MQLVHRAARPRAPLGVSARGARRADGSDGLSTSPGCSRAAGEICSRCSRRPERADQARDAELASTGELWHYSNLVFALLGEIVMRVTGEAYADVLEKRILDPLGLTRTSLRPDAPKASPYYVDPYADSVRDEPDPEVTESTGAAGWLWSLSKLTLQHEGALVLVLEQIYRAYTIKAGLPYHRD